MRRILGIAVLLTVGPATPGLSQLMPVGPGSTVQGDYLRGLGVAAYGSGLGNFYNAQATAIYVDTEIRVNEYIAAVLKNENAENAAHRHAKLQREHDAYNKMRERILKDPNALDVDNGAALNGLLEQMNVGRIQDSTHKYADITIPADFIKKIPFKLAEAGAGNFSMAKLTLKRKGGWPLAFQDPYFDRERRKYDAALDRVLDEHNKQEARIESINKLVEAIDALSERLDRAPGLNQTDARFIEARRRLRDLDKIVDVLKKYKIQTVLAHLDRYSGTTVNDLRVFMRVHNLQFAAAETVEERAVFPELYEKMKIHLDKVSSGVLDEKNN